MDVIVEQGYGLDVHKETVVACIDGGDIKKEIWTYGTFTNDLLPDNIANRLESI